jgi:metallo-beta-lactamase class B
MKCDVFLGAHGGYYSMIEKYKRMQSGAQPNPFIDPGGYRAFVDSEEAHFRDQLSRERVRRRGQSGPTERQPDVQSSASGPASRR